MVPPKKNSSKSNEKQTQEQSDSSTTTNSQVPSVNQDEISKDSQMELLKKMKQFSECQENKNYKIIFCTLHMVQIRLIILRHLGSQR